MISPEVVLDAIVAKIRAIPDVVTELGSADKVMAFKDVQAEGASLTKALQAQERGTVLVAWTGVRPTVVDGGLSDYEYTLYMRPRNDRSMAALYVAIVNGEVDGRRWMYDCLAAGEAMAPQTLTATRSGLNQVVATELMVGTLRVPIRE